jgi:hypothetical protein
MKIKTLALFCVITFSLFLTGSCSTAEDVQYTLNVTVAAGVTGTPVTGAYTYSENEVVNFSYTLQTGYENLVVTLDGVTVGNSGVITMNTTHTLTVTAEEIFDVSGNWTGEWVYPGSGEFPLECTFTGGYYSGTVNGNMEGGPGYGNGPYTISNGSIEFEFNYGPGTVFWTGTIDDSDHMSGTWIAQPGGVNGNWTLERQ